MGASGGDASFCFCVRDVGSGAGRTQFGDEGPRMNESDIPNTTPGIFGWEVLEHGV